MFFSNIVLIMFWLPSFRKILASFGLTYWFVAASVCAQSTTITYLTSSENNINGSTELVRFENGKIASRILLGHNVVFGYSDSHVASMGYIETGLVLRTWSLSTGEEQTRCVVKDLPAFPLTMMIGASRSLFLEPSGSQVLYVGHKTEKKERELRSGRKVPYNATVFSAVALDLHFPRKSTKLIST